MIFYTYIEWWYLCFDNLMYKLCVLNNRKEQLLNKEKSTSLDGLVKSPARKLKRSNTIGSPRHTKMSKLNMGEARDDVHVCIMCLRAIMNHQVSVQPIKLFSSCCMVHNQVSVQPIKLPVSSSCCMVHNQESKASNWPSRMCFSGLQIAVWIYKYPFEDIIFVLFPKLKSNSKSKFVHTR